MHPNELLRSRAFRLALFYTALFGISVALLLAFIYWTAGRFVSGNVDEFVLSEIAMYEADFQVDGPAGVQGLMRERTEADRSGRWIYLYQDASGRKLAGTLDAWPENAQGPDGFLTIPSGRGEPDLIRAREARLPDGSRLLVGLDDYEATEIREGLARAIGLGVAIMLVLAIGGGALVSHASLRQVERINAVIHQIVRGDLQGRVPVFGSGDEFDRLGRNINNMLERIQELMRTVKGITDDVAHDLRLPLARHRARLETALARPPAEPELQRFLGRSIDEVDSILSTFSSLLRIANVESGALRSSFAELDLAALVRDAEQLFEPMAAARPVSLTVHSVPRLVMRGNRDLLFQALSNLLDNAIKFSAEGGRVELRLAREAGTAILEVADSGPGIPVHEREKVFERFYRLDHSRSTPGSGLGLSLVRAVAVLHEATCRIEDNAPGARIVLRIPVGEGGTPPA